MAKVIDAFLFAWELDVLDIRLHELDAVVDNFVMVEALEMHGSARTKERAAVQDIIAPFQHKITHVVLEHLEPAYTGPETCWPRENFHRNALMPAVLSVGATSHDAVLLSDCDEIPRIGAVRAALNNLPQRGMTVFDLDFFYYNVNSYVSQWTRSTIGTLAQYHNAGGFQAVRDATNRQFSWRVMPKAGWHLSYFGDLEMIRRKVSNFAHAEDAGSKAIMARTEAELAADIAANRDLYRRPEMLQFQKRASNDPTLPVYFLANPDKYEKFTEEYFKQHNAELLKG